MKPISLTMRNFSSYLNDTVIDFSNLNQNLFLVFGETGSGKTSIFDAITFALYGKGSGSISKREGEVFQSRYSDYKESPLVQFVFEINGKRYQIDRTPPHNLLSKKGYVHKNSKLSLFLPDGTEAQGSISELDEKIVSIVGLTKEQFMQVAMIAQGDFIKILNDKPNDKKEAFRRLFNTGIYKQIEDKLKELTVALDKKIGAIGKECAGIISGVCIPDDIENLSEVVAYRDQIKEGKLGQLDEFIDCLKEINDRLGAQKNSLKKEINELSKKKEELIVAKTEADNLIKSFKQLEEAKNELAELGLQENEIVSNNILANKILKAYELKALIDSHEKNTKLLDDEKSKLADQEKILPDLKTAQEKATENASKTENDSKTSYEKFAVIEADYKSAIDSFNKKELLSTKLTEVNKEYEEAIKNETESKNLIDQFTREVDAKNTLKTELTGKVFIKAQIVSDLENNKSILNKITEINSTLNKIDLFEKEILKNQNDYVLVAKEADDAEKIYKDSVRKRDNARAGIIAKELLKPGCPCPVCGGLDHDNPCVLEDESALNIDLDTLFKNANIATQKRSALSSKIEAIIKNKDDAVLTKNNLSSELVSEMQTKGYDVTPDTTIDSCEELVNRRIASLNNELDAIVKNEQELISIDKFIVDYEKKINSNKEKCIELTETVKKLDNRIIELKTEIGAIKINYNSVEEATAIYNQELKAKEEMDKKNSLAKNALEEASQKVNKATALIQEYVESIPNLTIECERSAKLIDESVENSGISVEECLRITGSYTKANAIEMNDAFNNFNMKKSAAQSKYDTALEFTANKVVPDLNVISNDLNEISEKITEKNKAFDEVSTNCRIDEDIFNRLKLKNNQNKDVVNDYEKYNRLYRIFAGSNTGSRMDLETYVQRYYLSNVLRYANRRYYDMTNGKLRLEMTTIDQAGQGGNKGLDLVSYSLENKGSNSISSLSGGQTFLAALALAMGLSDEIALHSCVDVNMMFIDEGFGSLSKQYRDTAIRLLKADAENNKLVGIISHVEDLKAEIENKLLVSIDDKGSHIKWDI